MQEASNIDQSTDHNIDQNVTMSDWRTKLTDDALTLDDAIQAVLFRDRVKMLIYKNDGVDPLTVPDLEVFGAINLLVWVYQQSLNVTKPLDKEILDNALPSTLSQELVKLTHDLMIANKVIARLVGE